MLLAFLAFQKKQCCGNTNLHRLSRLKKNIINPNTYIPRCQTVRERQTKRQTDRQKHDRDRFIKYREARTRDRSHKDREKTRNGVLRNWFTHVIMDADILNIFKI